MLEINCPKCKFPMKKSDHQFELGMDTYVCISCGTKQHYPRKSQDQIAKEERFKKLDKDRATSEGIVPDNVSETEFNETTQLQDKIVDEKKTQKEVPKPRKVSSAKIKNMAKEISELRDKVSELEAKLEIKKYERDTLNKNVNEFVDSYSEIIEELKSNTNDKINKIAELLRILKRKLKQ